MKRKLCFMLVSLVILLTGCSEIAPLNEQLSSLAQETVQASDESKSETQAVSEDTGTTEVITKAVSTEKQTSKVQPESKTTKEKTTAVSVTEKTTVKVSTTSIEDVLAEVTESGTFYSPDENGIDPDKPLLALTFDDGPSPYTARLLDAFKEHGGKGTFFVVGNRVEKRKKVVQRIVDEGHEIANHSWSHPDLTNLSQSEMAEQLIKTNGKIFEVTGVNCKLIRPPYGAYDNNVVKIGKGLDMAYIMWSFDTLDWKTKDADKVYDAVMRGAGDGVIILCHDLHETTVDAMERAIPDLIDKGYQLVTVSELLTANGDELEGGKVYNKLK